MARLDTDAIFREVDHRLQNRIEEMNRRNFWNSFPLNHGSASNSVWGTRPPGKWTNGFWPGMMWIMADQLEERQPGKAEQYRADAERWTMAIVWRTPASEIPDPWDRTIFPNDHDQGFVLMPSFHRGYDAIADPDYLTILRAGANQLRRRFDSDKQAIPAWNNSEFDFPIIVDTSVNLELMFWASNHTGNPVFRDQAIAHAKTAIKHLIREDGSSYHVAALGGEEPVNYTHQGWDTESTWSRGQAWVIYGYTMIFRELLKAGYSEEEASWARDVATSASDYFITHSPADGVPYWDFELPQGVDSRYLLKDSSAAAVAAAGMLELATLVSESDEAVRSSEYFQFAELALGSLASPAYFSDRGPNDSLMLLHSVHGRDMRMDQAHIYGDYYFVEALQRYDAVVAAFPIPTPTAAGGCGLLFAALLVRRRCF